MGLGDCMKCCKYLIFVFNLLFCILGLAILALGIFVYVAPDAAALNAVYGVVDIRSAVIGVIVLGAIVTVLGFLGCCGAIFENRVLLVIFFILLLLVFLALVAIGVLILVWKAVIVAGFKEAMNMDIKKGNASDERHFADKIQTAYGCCGGDKAEKDYTDLGYPIPASCHSNSTTTTTAAPTYVSCTKLVGDLLKLFARTIAIMVFVTALIALLGMIFSMTLCCAISDIV